jgi:hypothetical protein
LAFFLGSGYLGAFLLESRGHFAIHTLPGRGQLLPLLTNGGFAGGHLGLFSGERSRTAYVSAISGAAKDSVSLISVRQFGQVRVGSVIDASNR